MGVTIVEPSSAHPPPKKKNSVATGFQMHWNGRPSDNDGRSNARCRPITPPLRPAATKASVFPAVLAMALFKNRTQNDQSCEKSIAAYIAFLKEHKKRRLENWNLKTWSVSVRETTWKANKNLEQHIISHPAMPRKFRVKIHCRLIVAKKTNHFISYIEIFWGRMLSTKKPPQVSVEPKVDVLYLIHTAYIGLHIGKDSSFQVPANFPPRMPLTLRRPLVTGFTPWVIGNCGAKTHISNTVYIYIYIYVDWPLFTVFSYNHILDLHTYW